MSSWADGRRPLTLAILALGGEGGGVLADWVVSLATDAGWLAQNTSVAGVAQRTGATVYYVEMAPPAIAPTGRTVRAEPVMSIFPTPGEVDVVIASELMECGRAIQRGFCTPGRTVLITSTHRVYSIDERMALGDGRVDDALLLGAARDASRRLVAGDFASVAEGAGSVISASLFGALAASEALPFAREQFERTIRSSGRAAEPSLAAFSAAYDLARAAPPVSNGASGAPGAEPVAAGGPAASIEVMDAPSRRVEREKAQTEAERRRIAAADPTALVGPDLHGLARRVGDLPEAARSTILHGLVRTAVYQDVGYAERYLDRVGRLAAVDPDPQGAAALTVEAARHLALWMCYQDTIHVALQKTRRARLERIRTEARAGAGQRIDVHEFLHPRVDEITDTLPAALGASLRRSRTFQRLIGAATRDGMILNTTSVRGYTLLTLMARCRPLRPRSLRFQREQRAIDAWLTAAREAALAGDASLAGEILSCQGVLKGYGETWERGETSFRKLMAAAGALAHREDAGVRLAELRAAALADEAGAALDGKLREYALAVA